ncbi:MAG: serine/threonine protein kinase, partial [Planctomycetales bacterium]|nr:serine/threonine protein kinase [Planctomycetales bacterium]
TNTLSKLSHPNIFTVFDFCHTESVQSYFVIEYVNVINLRDAIENCSIEQDDALDIVATMCRALEYAHAKGVVHRDIKPENILLGDDGTLKIADFGIAKIVDESVRTPTLTATRQVLGSLHYLAPEHLEAPDQVNQRVDLYALGVVFYEMLTGQLPLGRYEPPSAVSPKVGSNLDAIVMKALSRRPNERYQSAAELGQDVAALQSVAQNGSSTQATVRQSTQRVSVPFTCETMGGLAEAVGVLYAEPDCLTAEFRIRDAVWGKVKTDTTVVNIPVTSLTRMQLVAGVFGSKIVFSADKISTLGKLPNAESGRVELKIKKSETDLAGQLVEVLGFGQSQIKRGLQPSIDTSKDANRFAFGLLLLVCSFFNMGMLAVVETINAFENIQRFETIALAIGAAVVLLPVIILQLLGGISNMVARPRGLSLAAAIVSMLPVTPVFIASCPLAIWALHWARVADSAPNIPQAPKRRAGWGATTMLYIRESRWARVVLGINVLAAILCIAGFAIFNSKTAQETRMTQVDFRVVTDDFNWETFSTLSQAVHERLYMLDATMSQPSRTKNIISVRVRSDRRNQVIEQLRLKGDIQLVWLQAKAALASAKDDTASPVAAMAGLDLSDFLQTNEGLGSALYSMGEPVSLSGSMVVEVDGRKEAVMHESMPASESTPENGRRAQTRQVRQLIEIELSSAGRKALTESIPAEAGRGGLGLVIDGLVQGIARLDAISPDRITFKISGQSDLSENSIVSAIRGPDLGYELEVLSR